MVAFIPLVNIWVAPYFNIALILYIKENIKPDSMPNPMLNSDPERENLNSSVSPNCSPGLTGNFEFSDYPREANLNPEDTMSPNSKSQTSRNLLLALNDGTIYEITLLDGETKTFGRDDNATDYKINDPRCSRNHFSISLIGQLFILKDLNSSNGTMLNGERISSSRSITNGDVIIAGHTEIRPVIR